MHNLISDTLAAPIGSCAIFKFYHIDYGTDEQQHGISLLNRNLELRIFHVVFFVHSIPSKNPNNSKL